MSKKPMTAPAIPAIGEGKRGEKGHIGYLLRQAHAAHRIRMEQALRDTGVTVPQFLVLTMIAAYPGVSGADLARLSLLTPQTMSVIVTNLERDGMVFRQPHAEHGRIQLIGITEAGKKFLASCKTVVAAAEKALLDGLSTAEEQTVRKWLVLVALQAEEMG
jgi:DNA-binding MarR family transcriptional regulator